jgi:hypothetical protein
MVSWTNEYCSWGNPRNPSANTAPEIGGGGGEKTYDSSLEELESGFCHFSTQKIAVAFLGSLCDRGELR